MSTTTAKKKAATRKRTISDGSVKTTTRKKAPAKIEDKTVSIPAPNFETRLFTIRGTSPFVQHRFSEKARNAMREAQEAGSAAKKGKKRQPRDFKADYEGAQYKTKKGKNGIPAAAFRNAMVSACKIVGFHMTKGKLAIFVEADDYDKDDNTGLVLFTKGEPEYHEGAVRNATGVADLRARPMWEPGWEMDVRIRYDADMFTELDVTNLLLRAGLQVGVGEGRADSKSSCGCGWGMFEIKGN